MPGHRAIATLVATLAIGAGAVVAGCGGGSSTPATTAADGRGVYDEAHNVITLTPGPKFIIRMPDPDEGAEWRLMDTTSVGGVSLAGMQQANGGGDWNFDTIGAGSGVLEFRKFATGADDPDQTMTFEVEIT